MSAAEALDAVAAARHDGRNVFAETCPQYLYLTLEDHLARPGFEGAKYVCSPPVRSTHDRRHHHADLWKGLRVDELAIVSTDHCPFCMKDQKEMGIGNFSKIPNGMGTVEHRMDLIYQGVVSGQISLTRWVETCCTTPARMFGMYPKKGVIAPGSDADLVVYDPGAKTHIGVASHHMNIDYSAWEGTVIDGGVSTVLSRGALVIDAGAFVGSKGHGQYIKRGLSQYLM
jgi:dihydropyrimidinase